MPAQESPASVGPDPYTNGEPDALKRAGYVSYGPFPIGKGRTTADVQHLLRDEPIIWIETAHVRLGCSLPAVKLGGGDPWTKEWVKGVRKELRVLRTRFPKVKTSTRRLDPWLRAHLFALRVERIYGEVTKNLGYEPPTDDDEMSEGSIGLGPYVGMKQKPVVLLLRRGANLARYTRAYFGHEMSEPVRNCDHEFGCFHWGVTLESANGWLAPDLAMHSQLTFNLAHNLYSGLDGFQRRLPAWLVTGLGHWHARSVTKRFPAYDRRNDQDADPRNPFWEWQERVPAMAKKGVFMSLEKFAQMPVAGDFELEHHIQAWAVIDYLAKEQPDELFRFVHLVKRSGAFPDQAFEEAFGEGMSDVEQQWLAAASKKRRR